MLKNIIFDMDGTLVNSSRDIIDCLTKAYQTCNIIIPEKINKSVIGSPLPDMIEQLTPGLSKSRKNLVIAQFRKLYDNADYRGTNIYLGIQSLLKQLQSMDFRIFIATNKPFIPAKIILNHLGLYSFFQDIITPDKDLETGINKSKMIQILIMKWKLKKDCTLMVGDSVQDILAAHDNGILSAAILWGYGTLSNLCKVNPTYVLKSVEDLYNLTSQTNSLEVMK